MYIHPDSLPEHWKTTLKEIQKHFPQAVIAGGALRDLYHGKAIKDIDVFVPVKFSDEPLWQYQLSKIPQKYTGGVIESRYTLGEYSRPLRTLPGYREIYKVYRFTPEGSPNPFEMIFIQDVGYDAVNKVSKDFDINICQVEFDGYEVYASVDCIKGIMDRTIRIMNVNRPDRQTKRLARLTEKYPEYKIETEVQSNVYDMRGRPV